VSSSRGRVLRARPPRSAHEAMSSHRPYRPALGMEGALEEVRAGAGADYRPEVAAACLRAVEGGFAFTPEPEG